MSYSNITVVTSQGTFGYQPGTPFVPISYNTLDLIPDIPHNAQLEVERIFSIDRNNDSNAIPNFLNDTNVSVTDKQRVFIIPTDRITYNINTKQITNILLPSSGNDVYNFSYIPISGPNVGQPQTIAVPQLRIGDNIIVRRKTVSNTPLVLWTAGSKLTTAQLNLNTRQLLFLIQELFNKITITSVSTEQILDNAITTSKILNGSVTSDKLFDLNGPKRLLGSGNVSANVDGKYDVQELTLGDGFYWDQNSTVLQVNAVQPGNRADITVVDPNSQWTINNDAVTFAKMQNLTASRLLGRGSSGSGDPQELTTDNSLTMTGTLLSVTTPLTDGSKGDLSVSSNGTVFTVANSAINTNKLLDNAVTLGKLQHIATNKLLGRSSASTGSVEALDVTATGLGLINLATKADMRTYLELGTAALSASSAFATSSHAHGNISNTGTLGTTANIPLITGSDGLIQAGSFGTTANTFCQGNDSRLSDARTPTAHTHSMSDITSGTLGVSRGGTGLTAAPSNGQLLIGTGTGFNLATLTAGDNVTITNNQGQIIITSATTPVTPSAVLADGTYGNISISGNTWTVVNDAILTAKIADDQVTFAKLQNIATNKLLGRATAGSGNVEEIDLTAAGRALLDDTDATAQRTTLGLGTAATASVPTSGNAASNEVVLGSDTRLTDTRTPTDNTVSEAKLQNLAVSTGKIANNAVTYGKMQTITTGNRVLGSTTNGGTVSEVQVAEGMIATNAVTSDKINASAVTEAKIASNAVTTAKITDRNVTFIKLPASTTANRVLAATTSGVSFSELQVQTDMIADAAITAAKIAPGAITFSVNDLAAGSITASLLATDSVITAKIQDGAVVNAKISNRAGNSVMGRAANTAGAVADITASTSGHALRFDGTNVGFGTIPEAGIADGAITTNKIGDGQVTSGKILDGSITTSKLASNAIVWPQCVQTHVSAASVLTGGSTNAGTATAYRNNAVEITPLNTNITPRSANSKVLVTFNLNGETVNANGIMLLTRTVGGVETIIGDGAVVGNRWWGHKTIPFDSNYVSTMESYIITYLDSPNTTNEVTYKIKIAYNASTATQTFYLNRTVADANDLNHERSTSQCILQEYFA